MSGLPSNDSLNGPCPEFGFCQVGIGLHEERQPNLGLLYSLSDALNGHAVASQVTTGGSIIEVSNDVADKRILESSTPKSASHLVEVTSRHPSESRKRRY